MFSLYVLLVLQAMAALASSKEADWNAMRLRLANITTTVIRLLTNFWYFPLHNFCNTCTFCRVSYRLYYSAEWKWTLQDLFWVKWQKSGCSPNLELATRFCSMLFEYLTHQFLGTLWIFFSSGIIFFFFAQYELPSEMYTINSPSAFGDIWLPEKCHGTVLT